MKKRDIAREDVNNARRDICDEHIFVKVIHKIDRWKCYNCGYEANGSFVKGYEEGVHHESRNMGKKQR